MESYVMKGLLIALILAIAFHMFASRYAITTPIVNRLATEAYMIDRWTGKVWFCQNLNCSPVIL